MNWKIALPLVAAASATLAIAQNHSVGSIFSPLATPADRVYDLSVLVLAICGAIFVIVAGLLTYAIIQFRGKANGDGAEPPQVYGSNQIEIAWTVVPILIVVVLTVATARITSAVQNRAMPGDALKVAVVGHQYWWEFRYTDLGITTANELHVPVSSVAKPKPTAMTLESADVTHSFWVPQLAGKTSLIPNRTNHMWIDPREIGVYPGNCAEYCGTQHANMQLRIVVESQEDFDRWVAKQKQAPAEPPADSAAAAGRDAFVSSTCMACHTVEGTIAQGALGPNLTHLMSRQTLGAKGDLANTPANLRAWIQDPHQFKSGVKMPPADQSGKQLDQIAAWLETLQ